MRLFGSVFLLVFAASACKKSNDGCAPKTSISVFTQHTDITEGWDLTLDANYTLIYKYTWNGPNGWSAQANGGPVTRTNVQLQDAGAYYVTGYNDKNCEVHVGSVVISVKPIVDAPCQAGITNNTCTTDLAGLPVFSPNAVYFSNVPNSNSSRVTCYIAPPAPGNSIMYFTFAGYNRPRPGIYKAIYGSYISGKEDEVCVNLSHGLTNVFYTSLPGDNVYVTLVNGKTQICFCNIRVSNAPSGNINYISGKLTIGN